MKKYLLIAITVIISIPSSYAEVVTLRGANKLSSGSNEFIVKQWQSDREPMPRAYVQQPPLVPHRITGYTINASFNKCLSCHSWANYRKTKATKVSLTHFEDREGNIRANVAARRYFCIQCHVPQVKAEPLIENTFEPLYSVRHKR